MKNTNSLRDEIKLEQKKMKNQPISKKLSYFWEYYRLHVLIVVSLFFLILFFTESILSKKDCALHIVWVNSFLPDTASLPLQDLEEHLGIDPSTEEILIDSSLYITDSMPQFRMSSEQKLLSMTAAGDLDLIICDEELFITLAGEGYFHDLSSLPGVEPSGALSGSILLADVKDDSFSEEVPVGICIADGNYAGIPVTSERIDNAVSCLNYFANYFNVN